MKQEKNLDEFFGKKKIQLETNSWIEWRQAWVREDDSRGLRDNSWRRKLNENRRKER